MVSIDSGSTDDDRSVFAADGAEPSISVIRAVSAITGDAIEDLPYLHDVVDPDALDAVATASSSVTVSFTYAGCDVTVTADGPISVTPAE